ncbi:MAG: class I SAM-dependent methyltransferase [Deltaproteobacteria bacterium]|nr:class I SAM-dependent methyltransferase [Deltaproteobacteria bacterium]
MVSMKKHNAIITENFGSHASAYLTSATHAVGEDLDRLGAILREYPEASFLDMGCGAGHVSYAAAPHVRRVTAYDLSGQMLEVVAKAAEERGVTNLETRQGVAESLPFADASFDVVASRYSAHHWHDIGKGLREAARVLKPGGLFIAIDVASPGYPVLDVFLQTVELLRDTSHVRDYAPSEWLGFIQEAGLSLKDLFAFRIRHDFAAWTERMATPEPLVQAIRELQKRASEEVARYFAFEEDGSFSDDVIMLQAVKGMHP